MNIHIVIAGDFETERIVGAFTDPDEASAFASMVEDHKTLETNPDLYDANVVIKTYLANDPFTDRAVFTAVYRLKNVLGHRSPENGYEVHVYHERTNLMPSPATFKRRASGEIHAAFQALSEADAAIGLGELLAANNVQV